MSNNLTVNDFSVSITGSKTENDAIRMYKETLEELRKSIENGETRIDICRNHISDKIFSCYISNISLEKEEIIDLINKSG